MRLADYWVEEAANIVIVNEDETGNFPLTYEICKFLGVEEETKSCLERQSSPELPDAMVATFFSARTQCFQSLSADPRVNINDQSSAE